MLNIAHIYASNAKLNSGDFMIGIATKQYFKEKYLNNASCSFKDFDCRSKYDLKMIENLNKFDYIILLLREKFSIFRKKFPFYKKSFIKN